MRQDLLELHANEPIADRYFRLDFSWPLDLAPPEPGQFLTLSLRRGVSPLLRRPFAFSNFDQQKRTAQIIYEKRGEATTYLTQLKPGALIDGLFPLGNVFPQPQKDQHPILVAGGVGMGPIFFFAQELVQKGFSPIIFLGARSSGLIPTLPLFKQVPLYIATDDGSLGYKGTVVDCLRNSDQITNQSIVYVCGPNPMMAATFQWGLEHHLPVWVSMEQTMGCAVGACMGCVVPVKEPDLDPNLDDGQVTLKNQNYARVCTEGPIFNGNVIDWQGVLHG